MSRQVPFKCLGFAFLASLVFSANIAVADTVILKASSIITMDKKNPRAQAIAFDTDTKKIIAVGSFEDVQSKAPQGTVKDLGSTVLMPGFIDPHNHPLLAGASTQKPAYWIAPYMGYKSWDAVKAKIRSADKEAPAGMPLIFEGLDHMLQEAPTPTKDVLDTLTPSGRPIIVGDLAGHNVYFNSAAIKALGWKNGKPPADPVGGAFGRNKDGTSNGVAMEMPAMMVVATPFIPKAIPHPLMSVAEWYAYMASYGITSTSEHAYSTNMYKAYLALAATPNSPLRLHMYQMSTDADATNPIAWPNSSMVRKSGIKLWADGSPWVGNVALSFGYLDNPKTRQADIILGPLGEKGMNYNRLELDQVLDKFAPLGYQMSIHCNGDIGFDILLDAYERALTKYKLLGTDHRWRIEHLGAARGDQFKRAASLGVTVSLAPFQYIYWGDLLDGTMFSHENGANWQVIRDAFEAGTKPSFHNDGPASPPIPLLNIQSTVTRTTDSGKVYGADQAITMQQALEAVTINGAYQLKRDNEIGSLEVGKYADMVELSTDLTKVDPKQITQQVKVLGTWVGGKKIDLSQYLKEISAIDPSEHRDLGKTAMSSAHAH